MDEGLGAGLEFVLAAGVEFVVEFEFVALFVFAPFVLVVLAVPLELGVSIRAVTACACADAGIVPDGVGVVPSEALVFF